MTRRSLLCPRCGHLIDGGESRCSLCGAPRPAGMWRPPALDGDWLVGAILAANVAYYLFSLWLTRRHALTFNPLALLSPDAPSLFLLGDTGLIPVLQRGRIWTLLTANYLHGGLLHIFFNMMALRQIAPWVAREFGPNRMFVIYTLSGVGGFVVSVLAGIPYTIGASAAVCGLIGALLFFGKSRGGSYGAAVYREVSGWVLSLAIFGFVVPGINNWGHGGGILCGVLLGKVLGYQERGAENWVHRSLALICLAATAAVLLWRVELVVVRLLGVRAL